MRRPSVEDILGLPARPATRDAIAEAREAFGDGFGGDTINGHAFAQAHVGRLIYVPEHKTWLEFTGHRWRPCDAGGFMQEWAARRAQDAIAAEERRRTDEAMDLTKVATKLFQDRRQQAAALASAAELPMLRVSAADLDSDPWLFGVKNGVIDLRSGRLVKGRPDQRITKQAGCAFDPDAEAPLFMAFLERVQPDPKVRGLLQRMAGYALIGVVDDEVLFFLHGKGASGKSTYANVTEAGFGDYAVTSSKAMIVRTQHSSEADRQVYQLRGARLASINETAKGDVFDDQKVKAITSRERISTRKLHAEAFSFIPTHTTILRGNFLPGVQDAGDGFWRRLVPIEFGVQIDKADRVPDLDRQIIAGELPGVLAWMVRGALEWQARGLAIPKAITEATEAYRESTDLFGQWLDECTARAPLVKTKVADLFDSFSRFSHAAGATPGFIRTFSDELVRRGFQRAAGRADGRKMVGIQLRRSGRFGDE